MSAITLFEEKQVRRAWNAAEEKWYFSIADVVAVLTDSPNPQAYWRVMKKRLKDEGNETVTNCHGLKMTAADGKQRMTCSVALRASLAVRLAHLFSRKPATVIDRRYSSISHVRHHAL
jgi:hypothetical protein